MVKPSLSPWKVELDLVTPEFGIVMKGWLKKEAEKIVCVKISYIQKAW